MSAALSLGQVSPGSLAAAAPWPPQTDLSLADALAGRATWERLLEEPGAAPYNAATVLAAHDASGLARGVRVLAVPAEGRLLALLPYRPGGALLGWRRANAAWSSPYTTSSNPLLSGEDPERAASALLDEMARVPGRTWILPRLTLDRGSGAALGTALARRGWPSAVIDPFERAVLDRRENLAAFEAGLDGRRRKDLRRRRRRLEEVGTVSTAVATGGPELRAAVEAFLVLEAAGWKGRRGTALASRTATAELARALFTPEGRGVSARADLLLLDGRPVAVSLALLSGGTAHLLKTTYDEQLSRFAPGILLEEEIIRALHRERFADRLDSASGPGNHLEALFLDRERVGDLVLATSATISAGRLERRVRAERVRRAWLRQAKDAVWAWRDRLTRPAPA